MVVKATCWLWPVYRPRNRIDSAEAASESIAAPLRTSLPPSSRPRFGRTSRQRRKSLRTVTSAHRTDVDPLDTDAMRKGSHPPWKHFTTLLACQSVASASRRELRPISRGIRCVPGEGTLGGAAGSGPEPAGRPSRIRATAATNPLDTTTKEVRSRERGRSCWPQWSNRCSDTVDSTSVISMVTMPSRFTRSAGRAAMATATRPRMGRSLRSLHPTEQDADDAEEDD
jgi:hypothetical protein